MSFSFNFADEDEVQNEPLSTGLQEENLDQQKDDVTDDPELPCWEWKLRDLVSLVFLLASQATADSFSVADLGSDR